MTAREAKVLTVSDGVVEGTREDRSGDALVEVLQNAGYVVVDRRAVADGVDSVAAALQDLCAGFAGLVATTGGTGFGPRDLTPEGTAAVLDRAAPGIAEAIRIASNAGGRGYGMLSRAIAGCRGASLIVNCPGSPGGAREAIEVVLPVLDHALDLLAGGHPH
jgi:molybdenum cofactor synthesis domain-containing protein